MIPPGEIQYIYSTPKKMFLARDFISCFQQVRNNSINKIKVFKYGPHKRMFFVKKFHSIDNQVNKNVVDKVTYKETVETKPRLADIE